MENEISSTVYTIDELLLEVREGILKEDGYQCSIVVDDVEWPLADIFSSEKEAYEALLSHINKNIKLYQQEIDELVVAKKKTKEKFWAIDNPEIVEFVDVDGNDFFIDNEYLKELITD